jgi:hypothetical protein
VSPEKERVELALVLADSLEIGPGDEDRDRGRAAQVETDDQSERRGLQTPSEGCSGRGVDQKPELAGNPSERQRREPAPGKGSERLEKENQTPRCGEDGLRSDGREVPWREMNEALDH